MTELERIAAAVELVAERLGDPNHVLVDRIATLEELLKDFVRIMEHPHSIDTEWQELLGDVREALGLERVQESA